MENKNLTPDQSLALIQQMISQTRRRVERNAGTPFLIFGYTTVATAIAVWYAVSRTQNPYWQLLWFAITVAAVVYGIANRRKNREKEVSTYIDRIVGYVWITIGGVGFLQSILTIFVHQTPILYIIVLLMGLGTALTGLIIRFHLCTVAGLVSAIVLAPIVLYMNGIDANLVFAAVFLVMMVIPGHVLNYKSNRANKQ